MGDPLILSAADIKRLKIALSQGTAFKATGPDTNVSSPAYTITNPTTLRSFDVSGDGLTETKEVLGTLIEDLQSKGIVG